MSSKSFSDFNLSPIILENLSKIGWSIPTAIQAECLNPTLSGHDVVGYAETGSGKTGAYCLPIIQRWLESDKPAMYALILLPTIELSCQVHEQLELLGDGLGLKVLKLTGGEDSITDSLSDASKFDSHVIVATPGKLLSMFRHTSKIKQVFRWFQQLVLDEADKMVKDHCGEDLQKILYVIPKKPSQRSKSKETNDKTSNKVYRQTQIFSATCGYNDKVIEKTFGFLLLNDYKLINLSTPTNLPAQLKQFMLYTATERKEMMLFKVVSKFIYKPSIEEGKVLKALVFVKNYADTRYYAHFFQKAGIPALQLNSNMKKEDRAHHIDEFKSGEVPILISTDAASRGLDVKDVVVVVNMNIPDSADSYRHRAGRTARAGNEGSVITFVYEDTKSEFLGMEKKLNLPVCEEENPDSEATGKLESYSQFLNWKLTSAVKQRINASIKLAKKDDIEMRKRKQYNDEDIYQDYIYKRGKFD